MSGAADGIETVDGVLAALDAIVSQAMHDADRIGYFAALYRNVTAKVAEGIATGFFDDGDRMQRLDVAFATRYLSALDISRQGGSPTLSWRLAFEAAASPRPIVLQHLLVGISAHINLDLGIAAATTAPGPALLGVRRDFDRINGILAALLGGIEHQLADISPWIGMLERIGGRHGDEIVGFNLTIARAEAWRFSTELAPLAPDQWGDPVAARDTWVGGLATMMLHPGLLTPALREIGAHESQDVARNIEVLDHVEQPDLQLVEASVSQEWPAPQ